MFWLLSLCFWVVDDFCWRIDLVPTCLGSVVFSGVGIIWDFCGFVGDGGFWWFWVG